MMKWILAAGLMVSSCGCSALGLGGNNPTINQQDLTNVVACGAQIELLVSTVKTQIPACFAAVQSIRAQNGK